MPQRRGSPHRDGGKPQNHKKKRKATMPLKGKKTPGARFPPARKTSRGPGVPPPTMERQNAAIKKGSPKGPPKKMF